MTTRCLLAVLAAVVVVGCDNPQRSIDSLRREIAEFRTAPTDARQAKIASEFARLDAQIAAIKDPDKAQGFREQVNDLRSDYQAAKLARALQDTKNAILGVGEALKDGARQIEQAFKSTNSPD